MNYLAYTVVRADGLVKLLNSEGICVCQKPNNLVLRIEEEGERFFVKLTDLADNKIVEYLLN